MHLITTPLFLVLTIQKRIFDPSSADFTVEMNAKSGKKVCNLGNLANAFEMAASKQLTPFFLVDQAQRLETRFAEKLVEHHLVTLKMVP